MAFAYIYAVTPRKNAKNTYNAFFTEGLSFQKYNIRL